MNHLTPRRTTTLRRLCASSCLLVLATGHAQPAGNPATVSPEAALQAQPTIELPPFEVRSEKDEGYLAQNTASGSRLNTSLKDTASPISVFTQEFLSDIGATDIAALSEYTVNTERLNGFVGDVANGNEFSGGTADLRVRGLPSTRMVNFFSRNGEVDAYNTERIELSRGPNALLFGLGGAGGAFNTTTKKADLRRTLRNATIRGGDYGAMRFSLDVNQPIVPGKAALRINALDDTKDSWRPHEGKDNRRLALAGRWQINPRVLFNVEFEKEELNVQAQRKWASFDSFSDWNAAGGRVDPKAASPGQTLAQTRAALGIATTPVSTAATTSHFWVWNSTDNVLINYASALAANVQSRSANTVAPVVPFGGTVAGSGPQENPMLLDFSVVPRDVSIGGPGIGNETRQDIFTTSLTVEPLDDLFVELAYNRQDSSSSSYDIGNTEVRVQWDTSPTTVTGAPNPHVLQPFVEITPNQRNANTASDTLRATASYERNLGKWFGRHRLAAMGERRTEERQSSGAIRKIVVGPPNTTSADHANNTVRIRSYVDLDGPVDQIAVANFRDDPVGRFAWVPVNNVLDTKRVTETMLLAAQSYFWKDRIVTTYGYRDDRVKDFGSTTSRSGTNYGVFTQGNLVATRNATPATAGGLTRTEGVVLHATSNLSLFYNTASSFNLANQANRIAPDTTAPNADGVSDDFGLKVSLLNGKVFATVTYYETATTRDAASLNAAISRDGVNAIWDALSTTTAPGRTQTILAEAGLTMDQVRAGFNAYTFDSYSQGWEYEVVANLRPNWRLSFNFADRVSKQTNTATELFAYMDQYRALWTANASVITAGGQTVGARLSAIDGDHETRLVRPNGLRRLGDARYSASVRTNYSFREGRLKGFGIGAGARWRGDTLTGYSATLQPLETKGYTLVDANLSYQWKPSLLGHKTDLSVQLNVNNLFKEDGIIPTRLFDNGEIRTYRFQDPRDWFLTVTAKF